MGEKIVVGPVNKGLRTDRTAFVIDNDSFPFLLNAYQWRGRVKRKRGTSLLGQLQRFIGTTNGSGNLTVTINPHPIASGISQFTVGTDVFVDPGGASPVTLITNSTGSATLDRTTGVLTITGSKINTSVIYYPSLPVMGLEDFATTSVQFPGTIAFDTDYSYNINTSSPYNIYDVSFYKNPAANAITLPGYVPKVTSTPTSWNGKDYQQFWTVNYQGALWETNGIDIPFTGATIGMQFRPVISTPPGNGVHTLTATTALIDILAHGLVVGDFIFINEVTGIPAINFQTGYVTTVNNVNQVTVTFPFATLPFPITSGSGMVQYLTSTAVPGVDCLRWYDGDPTNGNPPTPVPGNGWVNFAPPLNNITLFPNFSIADLPPAQYYLVGARMILPFKDRLLFFGPVIQTSTSSPIYLQDTVIYSQNGTPYYTASFTGDPSLASTVFHPILVPTNQTASPVAYWEDLTGFGGFIQAGLAQQIITVSTNQDALIIGFDNIQTRLIYSGNDIVPFNFFIINAEYGSNSTFSIVNLDAGVITRGNRGFIITSQTESRRIDLEIPDQIFEMSLSNNGPERVCAQRDFQSEWIYFTYASDSESIIYPNQTLQYNYRDNSWGIFNETYTTYGAFRKRTGYTWANIGLTYPTWNSWTDPWNSGLSNLFQPEVIAGNQQGYVVFRNDGTNESPSLNIQNITVSAGTTIITSPNHGLNEGDYILINGLLSKSGSSDYGAQLNGKIFSVGVTTTNTFLLNPSVSSSNYFGGGIITRMYVPEIQTKQFPVAWEIGRKTRIGAQQYLLTYTDRAQIQLLIFLSQNNESPYNTGTIVPDNTSINNSLIYSTILYTCPESTNLGLTPANINLQTPTANNQEQIWHRMNTSLIGDTVQIGFTMSDAQMRSFLPTSQTFTITGVTQANPAVLTAVNNLSVGTMISISGVQGMTQLNYNGNQTTIYQVISANSTSVTINLDSTAFTSYMSGGSISVMEMPNQFEEIELHGFIIDVTPSQMLV